MTFDSARFNATEFVPRQDKIAVPQLAAFFAEGEEAVWVVQSLTAEQNAIVNEAASRSQAVGTLVSAIMNSTMKERASAIQNMLGLGDSMPEDTVRRIEILVQGSVTPCDRETAVNISIRFPEIFYKISNRILELSGEGAQAVGKP